MNEYDKLRRMAEQYRKQYPKGTRIVLTGMGEDPRPIPVGTRGTVEAVDDIATVHCTFDNGRSLGLAYGEDSFRALTQEELLAERTENESPEEEAGMTMSM